MASPLRRYLNAVRPAENDLRSILRAGAEEAQRLIPKLIERETTGGQIRAAQLSMVLREVRALLSAMWGEVTPTLLDGLGDAAAAGADGEDILWRFLGQRGMNTEQLRESFRAQARRGVEAVQARAANNIPLSVQVYRTQALSQGWVDRQVQLGLLLGQSPREIARSVAQFINPNVPGGVSYAAMRLARTELNNAFHTAQIARYEDEPWVLGMQWRLSGSHPTGKRDICDRYAEEDEHGLGEGIFPKDEVPGKPHPQCLCYLTSVEVEEDEFLANMMAGVYDDYLQEEAPFPAEQRAEVVQIVQTARRRARRAPRGTRRRRRR